MQVFTETIHVTSRFFRAQHGTLILTEIAGLIYLALRRQMKVVSPSVEGKDVGWADSALL